jgi:ATP-binding cassette, subfamily C, bacterial CydCD
VKARLVGAIAAGFLALGSGIGLTAVAAWLIARAAAHPPVLELMVAVVAVRALGISKGVFRYAERLLAHEVAFVALARLRLQLYHRLVRLAPAGLAGWRRGDVLTRLADDVTGVQDRYARVRIPSASAALAGLLATAIAGALLPLAAAVLVCGLIVAGLLVPHLVVALSTWSDRRLQADRADLASRTVEALEMADELTVLGGLPDQVARVHRVADRLARAESRLAWGQGATAGLGMLTLGLTTTLILVAAIPAVGKGQLDGPALAVLALLPLASFDAFTGLTAAARDRARVTASLDRVDEVMAAEPPVLEPPVGALTPRPMNLTIMVRGLAARWPGAGQDALRAIDLDLSPGKRIALVGPSGAGKSTLLAVLLRFCPYTGDVHLGGVPLIEVPEQTLRATIGLAAADAHIFDSTVEANLRLARPAATPSELSQALARAGLWEWAETLPRGLQTPVGEHGHRLSGGQRQRLALARALLADVPVLLCDEPDSHLDPILADQLLRDLLTAGEDRSLVVVTHRLSGLEAFDEVVTLDRGRRRMVGV